MSFGDSGPISGPSRIPWNILASERIFESPWYLYTGARPGAATRKRFTLRIQRPIVQKAAVGPDSLWQKKTSRRGFISWSLWLITISFSILKNSLKNSDIHFHHYNIYNIGTFVLKKIKDLLWGLAKLAFAWWTPGGTALNSTLNYKSIIDDDLYFWICIQNHCSSKLFFPELFFPEYVELYVPHSFLPPTHDSERRYTNIL